MINDLIQSSVAELGNDQRAGQPCPLAPGQDLYALEPQEFTAARNALVKQLRRQDRKDDAAAVASLRRPPSTA